MSKIKYCLHHGKIKFVSSSHHVIFFLLYKFNAKSGKWHHWYISSLVRIYGKYVTGYCYSEIVPCSNKVNNNNYSGHIQYLCQWVIRGLLLTSHLCPSVSEIASSLRLYYVYNNY